MHGRVLFIYEETNLLEHNFYECIERFPLQIATLAPSTVNGKAPDAAITNTKA